jgi:hypothetical protein
MAGNIIDYLVVMLSLDTRDYKKGADEVRDTDKKTRDDIETTDKKRKAATKSQVDGIRQVKNEAIGLFLVFAGASSLKQFGVDLVNNTAHTDRFAQNIGVATNRLMALQLAMQDVGGQAGDADKSLGALFQIKQNAELHGIRPPPELGALGLTLNDLNNPMEAFLKLAGNGEKMDKRRFASLVTALGIPESGVFALEQGRGALENSISAKQQSADAVAKEVKAADDLQKSFSDLNAAVRNLTMGPLAEFANKLTAMLNILNPNAPLQSKDRDTQIQEKYLKNGEYLNAWRFGMARYRQSHGMTAQMPPLPQGWVEPGASAPVAQGDSNQAELMRKYLQNRGFSAEQSKGIVAGIGAEGGGLGMAANGAFGIGQWRGPRQRALFAKYGRSPKLHEQMDFLISELKGGDPGGASVMGQTTADHALLAYIYNFMRPGAGALGDVRRGRSLLAGARPGHIGRGGASHNVTIGHVTVNTKATTPAGTAKDMSKEMWRRALLMNANTGMAP